MNERTTGGTLISSILISDPHQTTYKLSLGDQQGAQSSKALSPLIHIGPLTCYKPKKHQGAGTSATFSFLPEAQFPIWHIPFYGTKWPLINQLFLNQHYNSYLVKKMEISYVETQWTWEILPLCEETTLLYHSLDLDSDNKHSWSQPEAPRYFTASIHTLHDQNYFTYYLTAYLMHNMIFFSCADTNNICNDSLFNAAAVSSSNLLHPVSDMSMSSKIINSIKWKWEHITNFPVALRLVEEMTSCTGHPIYFSC